MKQRMKACHLFELSAYVAKPFSTLFHDSAACVGRIKGGRVLEFQVSFNFRTPPSIGIIAAVLWFQHPCCCQLNLYFLRQEAWAALTKRCTCWRMVKPNIGLTRPYLIIPQSYGPYSLKPQVLSQIILLKTSIVPTQSHPRMRVLMLLFIGLSIHADAVRQEVKGETKAAESQLPCHVQL